MFLVVLAVMAAAISCPNLARADDPYVLWAKTWTTGWPYAVALSPKGELLVDSGAWSGRTLTRFSPGGQIISQVQHGDAPFGAQEFDGAGNRYVTGAIHSNGLFNVSQVRGFFTAKYGATDELLWVRSEGLQPDQVPNNSHGTAIKVDPDGNVVVGANARGPTILGTNMFAETPASRPLFCKYDSGGNLLWARRIEFLPRDGDGGGLEDLAVDPFGNVILCGSFPAGTADFGGSVLYPGSSGAFENADRFIAKYGPDGTLQWVQLGFYAASVVVDSQANIFAGWFGGLAKLTPSGQVLWSKNLPGTIWVAGGKGIALHPDGGVVFTGEFEGVVQLDNITLRTSGTGWWQDFFVALVDDNGNIQWALPGGGLDYDRGLAVNCDPQGIIFLTGITRSSGGSFGGLPLVAISNAETVFVAKISPKPTLKIAYSPGQVKLSWPVGATNFVPEATTSLPADSWTTVTNTPTVTTNERSVQLPLTGNARFFRLRQP